MQLVYLLKKAGCVKRCTLWKLPPNGATLHPLCTLQQHWKKKKRECFIFKRKETKSLEKNQKFKSAKMK
jgi:hypothetical protein